jgi:tetratricopeptide (TPR) repeat protein
VSSWIDRGRYEEAEAVLREQLRRFPHDYEARWLLARSLGARDQLVACADQLRRMPPWAPNIRQCLYLEGCCYLQLHRARDAEAAWRACIAPDALRPRFDAYFKMAVEQLVELGMLKERPDDARDAVWMMYDAASPADRPDILILLLRTWIDRIDSRVAADRLRRIVAADPADLAARRALAHALDLQGDPRGAAEMVESNLEAWPDDPWTWRDQLWMLNLRDDLPGLTTALAKLPPSTDREGEILAYRGLVCEKRRDWPCAADAYRRADELRPFNAELTYRLGMSEVRAGRREAGLRHLKQSRELKQALERLADAVLDYRDALVASPDPGDPGRVKAARALAAICRTLGMDRVAAALESVAPP